MIPAFNEAARLPPTLSRIREHLDRLAESYEIVVVDDGSSDATVAEAERHGGAVTRVLRNERNRGKGYSVRRGMLAARGARRLMSDADLSTPIEELAALAASLDAGSDVAIASRAVAGARVEVHQSALREGAGRAFNLLVRLLAVPGIQDTQCGFKLFTAGAAEAVFASARLHGFSFDVEALFIARKRGLRVAEVPVTWRNDAATRVSATRGALAFADLVVIRVNDLCGRYAGR